MMDGWTDEWMEGWTDRYRQTYGVAGRLASWMNGWMEIPLDCTVSETLFILSISLYFFKNMQRSNMTETKANIRQFPTFT